MSKGLRRAILAVAITAVLAAALIWWQPSGLYLWLKAAHVVAVISWMAGMLYLPRLFVYHAEVGPGTPQSETFKVMEWRLLTLIINPAMIATWVLGLALAYLGGFLDAGWLHAKFALVIAMSGLHGYFVRAARAFQEDRNARPARHWRIMNEVPTLLMIIIVVLVIVKPF